MLLEILVFTCFAIAILAMILVGIGYYFRHAQDLLLYHPDTPAGSTVTCETPKAWDIKNSEHLEIITADGVTLTGFLMRSPFYYNNNNSSNSGKENTTNLLSNNSDKENNSLENESSSTTMKTNLIHGNGASAAAVASSSINPNTGGNDNNNNSSNNVTPTLLVYFHGNAGNVGHRLSIAKQFLEDCKHCDVLMVDYRGYGLSDAVRPCEVGLQLDAAAVMDFVEQRQIQQNTQHKQKVIVMGVSLGGAVALYLASHRKYRTMLSGLILENTFVGISEMADAMLAPMIVGRYGRDSCWGSTISGLLRYFVKPLVIQIHWRSIDRVPQVGVPILFLSGLRDELVPPSHMKKLFENAVRAPFKRFVAFETGKHNDLCGKDGFFEQVGKFIDYVSKTAQ